MNRRYSNFYFNTAEPAPLPLSFSSVKPTGPITRLENIAILFAVFLGLRVHNLRNWLRRGLLKEPLFVGPLILTWLLTGLCVGYYIGDKIGIASR
jgi:hypothetical protein